jgi:hypothetical protein
MVLFRLLGSATGVAMGGSILDNQLASRLEYDGTILPYIQFRGRGLVVNSPSTNSIQGPFCVCLFPLFSRLILLGRVNVGKSNYRYDLDCDPLGESGIDLCPFCAKDNLKRNFVKAGENRPRSSLSAVQPRAGK